MPPRYAFWTILIDDKPTAFRARDKEELLPTFHQLKRKSPTAVMKWFAHGRLWETPEQAQWARKNAQRTATRRKPDWRPGGVHKDPRERFKRKNSRDRERIQGKQRHSAGPRRKPSKRFERTVERPEAETPRRKESAEAPPAPEQ